MWPREILTLFVNLCLGSQHRREEESFNREVTEKTTTVLSSPKRSPGGTKETFTKTTITETEETIEKKEVEQDQKCITNTVPRSY
jgi:hypothetical protein